MTTLSYENVDLRVMQQSDEIQEVGVQTLRGALSVNHDEGVATFVEDKKRIACGKNPVFWGGQKLNLRINKDGKIRGTFCVDVPADIEKCEVLLEKLDEDFGKAIQKMYDLSCAKRRPSPRSPYRNRVARGRVVTTERVA